MNYKISSKEKEYVIREIEQMRKYLSGGAGTGTKIIENHNIFRYEFKGIEKLKEDRKSVV